MEIIHTVNLLPTSESYAASGAVTCPEAANRSLMCKCEAMSSVLDLSPNVFIRQKTELQTVGITLYPAVNPYLPHLPS